MTSPRLTWAAATGTESVEEWTTARLRARWGAAEANDFDQAGLCAEWREALNNNLPPGWTLDGNVFLCAEPAPEDALETIRTLIGELNFWGIAQFYDNGD